MGKAKMVTIQKEEEEQVKSTMTPEESARHALLSGWFTSAYEAKKPIEWEWFVRKNFLDGNHWIKWNQTTNSLETVDRGNRFKTTINKIHQVTRAVRNYVMKYQPRWEVTAQDLDKKIFDKSTASERLLDLYYLEDTTTGKTYKRKLKEIVGDAMWASVGHIWYWWDAEKKWLCSAPTSPFDFFPDPTAKDTMSYSDALFVFRTYSKKVTDIKQDERFNHREDVVSDGKLAASDMQVTLIKLTSGLNVDSWTNQKDLQTAICYEGYVKRQDKNVKGGMIDHVILTATALLIDEPTKFTDMPARTYHTDVETDKQYTQGWVKNLIAPQKILNAGETQTLEFNHVLAKGRYVTEKGSGVNVVVNKNGQIITKNKNTHFEQLAVQPQVSTVENQITRASRYMEDLGAAHDAFTGRMPTGANSGVALDTLLHGEENNLVDLRDNLDDFLISNGKFILRAFSQHQMKIMTFLGENPMKKDPDFFSVVGKSSPIKAKEHTVTYEGKERKVNISRILEDNQVRVSIGTWLGTGKGDSQTRLKELYADKIIDQETVLEFYNAPNIPRIIENTRKRRLEEAQMQAAMAAQPGTMPALETPVPDGGEGTGGATSPVSPLPAQPVKQ